MQRFFNSYEMDLEKRIEWIAIMQKQNLNGRETEDELFEAGIKAGIEETEELTIEFADWLNNGRFSQYGSQWTNPKLPKNSKGDWIFFTSKQLYELFKRERSETVLQRFAAIRKQGFRLWLMFVLCLQCSGKLRCFRLSFPCQRIAAVSRSVF